MALGLYISVPFCRTKCTYCNFASDVFSRAVFNRYLDRVCSDLERAQTIAEKTGARFESAVDSLYLGGGTPSLLPASAIGELIDVVQARFGIADGAEVTLEANPGPDERGDAAALRAVGITRLSIGAQAMSAAALRRLGRRHRVVDVVRTVAEARAAGIGSISLDLLYDAPEATVVDWIDTLDAALALEPDHLSLYALTLDDPDAEGLTGPGGDHLPTTPGARRWRATARPRQDEDRAAAEYHHAVHRLAGAGWRGYEISNWARPGHESRHNLAYWERRPYEAVGPGAHAFDGATRRWNAASLEGYVATLTPADGRAPSLPPGGSETIEGARGPLAGARSASRVAAGRVDRAFRRS